MAGTKIGGQKAAQKNKEKYGKEFYAQIGAKGGKAKTPKGFAKNRDLARAAGRKGGSARKNKSQ